MARAATDIGMTAAACTTICFVPQLLRVWRLRSAREISLTMSLVFSPGTLLWLLCGILIHAIPVMLANGVTLALSMAILSLKVRFDRR
ncbi:MAG TPA: SemiSWEET transporter [Acidobacteriaceae bacterium]|nr:SemiSWEET transporter [Acidobacteriaceae bacterium]